MLVAIRSAIWTDTGGRRPVRGAGRIGEGSGRFERQGLCQMRYVTLTEMVMSWVPGWTGVGTAGAAGVPPLESETPTP